jgi:hypothetical protein
MPSSTGPDKSNVCETCGEPWVSYTGEFETLVGYMNIPGHKHNDNCLGKGYYCKNGHCTQVYLRRRCPACDWKGKETCECHKGAKVDVWPEAEWLRSWEG